MYRLAIAIVLLVQAGGATSTSVEPHYPKDAADRCLEGHVVLKFRVSKNDIEILEVVDSNPPGIFEEAARKNLSMMKKFYSEQHKPGEILVERFSFEMEHDCDPKS